MKKSSLVALVVIAVSLAMIFMSIYDSSTYADLKQAGQEPERTFHVVGELIKDQPQVYDPVSNPDLFTFYIKDNNGDQAKVWLNKSKPQDFEKSEKIVVIGKMKSDGFHAKDILMKCPSKYNDPAEKAKQLQGQR